MRLPSITKTELVCKVIGAKTVVALAIGKRDPGAKELGEKLWCKRFA